MDNDLISRSALLKKGFADEYTGEGIVTCQDVAEAPAVDAISVELLRRKLASEHTCLYGNDAEFLKNQGAYNPSAFAAGFKYALERLQGWATLLKEERR